MLPRQMRHRCCAASSSQLPALLNPMIFASEHHLLCSQHTHTAWQELNFFSVSILSRTHYTKITYHSFHIKALSICLVLSGVFFQEVFPSPEKSRRHSGMKKSRNQVIIEKCNILSSFSILLFCNPVHLLLHFFF